MEMEEIKALSPEKRKEKYFGIELKEVEIDPVEGVSTFGFIAKFTDDGLDDVIIDTIISYRLAGKEVFLEIPFADQKSDDAEYMMSLAENLSFSITLLPPESDEDADYATYQGVVWVYGQQYFFRKSFKGEVLPFSSYLQYMSMKVIADVSGFKPTDGYILDTFISKVDQVRVDALKADLRARTYELFEGEENFNTFVKALVGGVVNKIERLVQEVVEFQSGETDPDGVMKT
jgi:hypothetical protein